MTKTVHPCGCIRIRAMMNKSFTTAQYWGCTACRRSSCGMHFYNLTAQRWLCVRCHAAGRCGREFNVELFDVRRHS